MSDYFSTEFNDLVGAIKAAQIQGVIDISDSPLAFQTRQSGVLPSGIESIMTTIVTPHLDCEWTIDGQVITCWTHSTPSHIITLIG